MSGNLMLLYVKETGHILAAVSGAAEFGEDVTAGTLAGAALRVRHAGDVNDSGFNDAEFFVPSDQLAVFPTAFSAATLAHPRDSYVKTEGEQKKVVLLDLVNVPNIVSPLPNDTQVPVAVTAPDDTKVWIQLVGPDPEDTQVKPGKVTANVANVNVDRLKAVADYFVLVLVAGAGIKTFKVTTP